MKAKINNMPMGIIIGLLGPLLILFGVNVFSFPQLHFGLFLETGFSTGTINPYLKLAALFNLAPFFFFININYLKTCRGIVFATIIIGACVVYFTLM